MQKFAEEYPILGGFDFIDQVLRCFDCDLRPIEGLSHPARPLEVVYAEAA